MQTLNSKLKSFLTEYDRKESTKKHHNPYALGIYFERADDVSADVDAGADLRAAIVAGFTGRLCDFLLKKFGLSLLTKDESFGSGVYKPVKKI
jgi:hypothetical protein